MTVLIICMNNLAAELYLGFAYNAALVSPHLEYEER